MRSKFIAFIVTNKYSEICGIFAICAGLAELADALS